MNDLLSEDAIAQALAILPGWHSSGTHLHRTYPTRHWQETMLLAGGIAFIAEQAWHHPELRLAFKSVQVDLQTHDAGGITAKDIALATRIEILVGGDNLEQRPTGRRA